MHLRAALTSTKLGAAISNYCEVLELDKSYDADLKKQVCTGALVRDRLTGILFRFTITPLRLLLHLYLSYCTSVETRLRRYKVIEQIAQVNFIALTLFLKLPAKSMCIVDR